MGKKCIILHFSSDFRFSSIKKETIKPLLYVCAELGEVEEMLAFSKSNLQ